MRGLGRREWLGLVALFLGLASGCGGDGGGVSQTGEGSDDLVRLQSLAEDYRIYSIGRKKPPGKIDDMKVLETMVSPAVEAARRGEIIVLWGATLPDTKEEPGQSPELEILAYGKDVPEKGGYVLHLNRTVSHMTADAFKAAPKAAGKIDDSKASKKG